MQRIVLYAWRKGEGKNVGQGGIELVQNCIHVSESILYMYMSACVFRTYPGLS